MEVKKRRSESERERREEREVKVERERRKVKRRSEVVSDKKKKGQESLCAENQKGHFYSLAVGPQHSALLVHRHRDNKSERDMDICLPIVQNESIFIG